MTNKPNLPLSQASNRLLALDNSGWDIHLDAMQRLNAGQDIIPLSLGDPDFNTPDYVNAALIEAIQNHQTHYCSPSGEEELREELARLERRVSGFHRDPDQFSIFYGATGAFHAVLSCIANAGDNVVTHEPTYMGYPPTCATVGVELKTVPSDPPRFELNLESLLEAVDERTVAIVVNSPANPTGNIADPAELKRLAGECLRRNLWLICDEVYSLLYFDRRKHVSLLNLVEDISNVIVVDSLSKSHAMSGWRIGWTVSSVKFAKHLRDYLLGAYLCGVPFIQHGATYALRHNLTETQNMVQHYEERRNYTYQRVQAIKEFDTVLPPAGLFLMVDVHENGTNFARRLLDETGVSVYPGEACGAVTKNYVRVGLVKPMEVLREAWDRIENWVYGKNRKTA